MINPYSGLSEVVRNLIRNLPPADPNIQLKLFLNYFKSNTQKEDVQFPNTAKQILRIPRRLVNYWWKIGWPVFDSYLNNTDVFHSLHIDAPSTKKMKTILTVHDCRYLAYQDLYGDDEISTYRKRMRISLKRVNMICAVSEFTRQELIKYFNYPGERIKVIHNGFAPIQNNGGMYNKKADDFIQKHNLPEQYLLFIGTADPRKNLDGLIEALLYLKNDYKDIPPLLIAGIQEQEWSKSDIKNKAQKHGLIPYLHACGVLPRDLLIGLTQKAHILCYPSLYEGFGFPPLEAMSLGVPVLAGNHSSIPEIAGDAACLKNPEKVEDIAEGLVDLIYDQEYRKKLIESGYQRIKQFSWKKTARDYLSVYKEVHGR